MPFSTSSIQVIIIGSVADLSSFLVQVVGSIVAIVMVLFFVGWWIRWAQRQFSNIKKDI